MNALTREFGCPRFPVQAALWHALDELGQRGKHAAFPTIVNSTSSIELDRTQDKTCQLRGEELWIIVQLNPSQIDQTMGISSVVRKSAQWRMAASCP
jgi:hypothetical protein